MGGGVEECGPGEEGRGWRSEVPVEGTGTVPALPGLAGGQPKITII